MVEDLTRMGQGLANFARNIANPWNLYLFDLKMGSKSANTIPKRLKEDLFCPFNQTFDVGMLWAPFEFHVGLLYGFKIDPG